jgi:hypothetical protein
MNNLQLRLISIFMLALGLTVSHLALAQPIKVSSANPNTATQGTVNLDVEIGGNGFDSEVDSVLFLLPCIPEEEPCDDTGGIEVNNFTVDGRRKITANIDIAVDAEVADFDIEVRSTSGGGRGGKGTTLFSVHAKGGGGTGSTLSARFCLNMTDESPGLAPDGQPATNSDYDYCDGGKEQNVVVGTGVKPNFSFITNIKNRPPIRWMKMNFPGGEVTLEDDYGNFLNTFLSGDYQIDLRFNMGNGGLDLGSMQLESDDDAPDYFVPLNIWAQPLVGTGGLSLAYSRDTDPLNHNDLVGNTCIRDFTWDVQVKRLDEDIWSIESQEGNHVACLWFRVRGEYDNQTGTPVVMPFYFLIQIKE